MTFDNENAKMDLMDILLDPDNTSPIIFSDESGKQMAFEQIAVIPYDSEDLGERTLYAILKPVDNIDGIADDEVIVFKVDDLDGEAVLRIEENEQIARAVYAEYINLYEKELDSDEE